MDYGPSFSNVTGCDSASEEKTIVYLVVWVVWVVRLDAQFVLFCNLPTKY